MGGTNYYIESLLWKVLINTKVPLGGCICLPERVNLTFRAGFLRPGMVLPLLEYGKEKTKSPAFTPWVWGITHG